MSRSKFKNEAVGSRWLSVFDLKEYTVTEVNLKWFGTSMVSIKTDLDFESIDICLHYFLDCYIPLGEKKLGLEVGAWYKSFSFSNHRVCISKFDGDSLEYFWADRDNCVRYRDVGIDWFKGNFIDSYHPHNIKSGSEWLNKRNDYLVEVIESLEFEVKYTEHGSTRVFVTSPDKFIRDFLPR